MKMNGRSCVWSLKLVKSARAKAVQAESRFANCVNVRLYLENWIKQEADRSEKSCYFFRSGYTVLALFKGKLQFQTSENQKIITWSSYKERKGNALAPGAEEGRDKLRKSVGSRKWALIHRCPNGAIRPESYPVTVK